MSRAAWIDRVLDFCYPNRCNCCGSLIPYYAMICEECRMQLEKLTISYADWCSSEGVQLVPWQHLITVYSYQTPAREGILAMKEGHRQFAIHLAQKLSLIAVKELPLSKIDFVTWVPIAKRRRAEQGYGHSEYLAKQLAARLYLPIRGDLLTQEHTQQRQHHHKTAKERKAFAERFHKTSADVTGKTILLCDDVLTTGHTMRRCASLLQEMGAQTIYGAVGACRLIERQSSIPKGDIE